MLYLFILGHAGSLLLLWAFSSASEPAVVCGLRCGVRASHCGGFSLRAQALGYMGFSRCGQMGLVALQHVESLWIRDQTRVSYISRWILSLPCDLELNNCLCLKHVPSKPTFCLVGSGELQYQPWLQATFRQQLLPPLSLSFPRCNDKVLKEATGPPASYC